MSKSPKMDLLKLLFERGDLNRTNVRMLSKFMSEWSVSAFDAIVETKVLSEGRLADLLAELISLERTTSVNKQMVAMSALKKIPYLVARKFSLIPCSDIEGAKEVKLVVCDPTDAEMLDWIKTNIKTESKFLVSTKTEIQLVLSELYQASDYFVS